MEPWRELTSTVAWLPYDDVDTDTIIPQVELVTTGRDGLGGGLFANWRYDGHRRERPDFVLNQAPYRDARVLATGRNFGCGSSREHAAWALADFGIRCVLAPSFGPIFYRNCLRSRIAPLVVTAMELNEIAAVLTSGGSTLGLRVDLVAGRLSAGGRTWPLAVDVAVTEYVVQGMDEVERGLRAQADIARYERDHDIPAVVAGGRAG
jgi:3-isopropylmalate/(R)-2-methylmalate dehydratase small subunit